MKEINEINIEKKKEESLSVFIIRHGETDENKTNPNRGLTENGKKQVEESIKKIVEDIDSVDLPNVEFHLRDSGTERTKEQVVLEYKLLLKLGVTKDKIILTDNILKRIGEPETGNRPGISKRLVGIQGLDNNPEFRKKLGSKDYQKKVEANGAIDAWTKTPKKDLPQGVESQEELEKRYINNKEKLSNILRKKWKIPEGKRIIVIANSHESMASLAATKEFGIPINEVTGAQGMKMSWNDQNWETKPFGEDIEKKVEEKGEN